MILGITLISLPFIVVTWLMIHQSGWQAALKTWIIVLATIACIAGGVFLL